ncbi:MAG TPA: NAD(P)-dependent oxidoreductase [bacterium]|nr:NAD(P)-dependent oxidoreductase [bacterium]
MEIGFIGLGTMGASMAANLQKAGHRLTVHDLRRAAAEPHLKAGAVWADTPRQAATGAQIVFTSLPGPPEVEATALGPQGLLAGMRPDAAYFDLSTNSRAVVQKIHAAFAAKGAYMLDAPVSGGPRGAATRKLALWIGGDRAVFDRCKPVLDAIGDQVRYIGPIGHATVAKLVHNCSGYAVNAALAEAFTMGVKAGVDPLVLFEAIRQGAVGRRRTFDALIDQFLPNQYEPPAFALRLAHKDVSLAVALGREVQVPMALSELALQDMTAALERGWGQRDSRSAMLLQQERAGVSVAVEPQRLRAALANDKTVATDPVPR